MEITFQHVCNPCEYLLFDNVCSSVKLQECFNEVQLLSPAFKGPKATGSAKTEDGKSKKQNSGVFLPDVYTPNFAFYSPIATLVHEIIEIARERQYTAFSQMNYLKKISGYDILVSAYQNGDYYETHTDTSVLTVLFWFGESDNKGGDLVFTDFDHTVPFISNRIVIFPSYYQHEITKVGTFKEGYVRYSATAFLVVDGTIQTKQPATVGTNDF